MYNLFTVLNSAYMPFGKIWINSLYQLDDIKSINKIYILDTGLLPDHRRYFQKFNKVEIVSSDLNIVSTSDAFLGNSEWLQHVLRKTKYFRKVLIQDPTPLIMVDSDCIFINNFLKYIDVTKDVLVCNRSYHDDDNWIASFFVANKQETGLIFMNTWIKELKQLMIDQPQRGWFESHSLNLCLQKYKEYGIIEKVDTLSFVHKKTEITIGDLYTRNVACEEPRLLDKNTSILHFKGSSRKTNFNERINRFSSAIDLRQKLMEYLND